MYGIVGQNPIDYDYFIDWIDVCMKKELIEIIIDGDTLEVSGRELHRVLEIRTDYHKWMPRMVEYGFIEGVDYTITYDVSKNDHVNFTQEEVENMTPQQRSRNGISADHILTLDMAKHIAMIQRTPIGMEMRNFFIEKEKELREVKEKIDTQGSISKEEFYEIHFGNAKRIRKAFEMANDLNELFGNFLEHVSKMSVTEKVKRYEHLQKVLDDILNVRVRDLSIELNEVICLRSEITNMKLKLEELINETLNRSYAQQLRYAKEKTTA